MPDLHTAFCRICQPEAQVATSDILNHLRLFHGIEPVEAWPDGDPVIVDETADTVQDIGWQA